MRKPEPKFKVGDTVLLSSGELSFSLDKNDLIVIESIDLINSWYTASIKGESHPYTFSINTINTKGKIVIDYNEIWQRVLNEHL